jgi:transcriptional regulator with XRE-family HTH domain
MPQRLVVNGKKARELRVAANLKQDAAAVRIDLAASRLRTIEAGGQSVNLTTLGKLALLYGVAPGDLLAWVD